MYAIKIVLQAESVRDYADLLASFKEMPNIVVTDIAPRLAAHMNLSFPETVIFSKWGGKRLTVSLKWLEANTPKEPADDDAHPYTGSADHYSLLDHHHEKNWKAEKHIIRST